MEKQIEEKFCRDAKALGCRVIKFLNPSTRGAPDRLVLTPKGIAIWVEFKRPGEVPRHEQVKYMKDLNRLGFLAVWTDSAEDVTSFIRAIIQSNQPGELVRVALEAQRKAMIGL